jgi:GT2 family glycosyltransferase
MEGKKEIDKMLMNDFNHDYTIETDWVLGASIMISHNFIESIGNKLDERYFLYYEAL